jgi:hypothetical protein
MAIPAQGLTFTWGGSTLQEVQELDISQALQTAAQPTVNRFAAGRAVSLLTGEITLTGLSMSGLKPSNIGRARTLLITVPVSATQQLVLWHGIAQYAGQVVRAGVNGAVQLAHRFTLLSVSSRAGSIENI